MKQYIVTWVGRGDKLHVSELKPGKNRMVYSLEAIVFIMHAYSELEAVLKAKAYERATLAGDDVNKI